MLTQPAAIEVVGVTQHYGVRPILKDVDMTVRRGELVAIMGPNGSGKSTLMGVLAGALSPYRGYVQINGVRRRRTAADEFAIRKQVVFLPAEPWLPHTRAGRDWVLAVGRLWGVEDERVMDHAQRLMELFDLSEKADSLIGSYSTGQRKKLSLCAALITDAPILLLDEPFAGGLDPSGILALKRVLAHHAQNASATIVMATPVPELVEELAERVAVMRDGQLIAFDTVAELRRQAMCTGSLDQVYERLVHPEMRDKVGKYFDDSATASAAKGGSR